jgi:hypothetical protein
MAMAVKVHVRLLDAVKAAASWEREVRSLQSTGGQLEGSRSRRVSVSEGHRRLAGGFDVLFQLAWLFEVPRRVPPKCRSRRAWSYPRECRPFGLGD